MVLIGTISKSIENIGESLSTLMFAMRCKQINFKPIITLETSFDNNSSTLEKIKNEVIFFFIKIFNFIPFQV